MTPSHSTATTKNLDWHMSKWHETIISPVSKEEKLATYAAWAETFDDDVMAKGYTSPELIAKKIFSLANSTSISVIDIGCGTGLVVPPIIQMASDEDVRLNLVGLDYSKEMLDVAEKKGLYTSLVQADIHEKLPVKEQSFDFLTSGGVFVAGHCGPSAFPNISKCLKIGGYAIITIRKKTFEDAEKEYLRFFEEAGCEIVENPLAHYLGPVEAFHTVLQKVRHI